MEKKKSYSIKEQYRYHCQQSKKSAVNKDGEPLSDMARGIHIGKLNQIASNAKLQKKIKDSKRKTFKAPNRTFKNKDYGNPPPPEFFN